MAPARFVGQVVCVSLALLSSVLGYIPAQPSNDTTGQTVVGLSPNQTDTSLVILNWFPSKSTQEQVSYQIIGNNSNGLSQGALVHFSEHNLTNSTDEYSATPWIAFVACDANATNESLEDDIFTLAQARGALSALLYSQYSNSCIINPEYADPKNFAQLFDVFSTKKLVDAQLIESQYTNIATEFSTFNASLLNSSLGKIDTSIAGGPTAPGYLMATLLAANATAQPNSTTGEQHPRNGNSNSGGGAPNTGLAMIILYAITGCVSALFCVVIISGAIRAVRNPDRYGPRADDTLGGGRSRTAGLGRAILDTFPIIKFGQSEATSTLPRVDRKGVPEHDDSHSSPMIELADRRRSSRSSQTRATDIEEQNDITEMDQAGNDTRERKASTSRSTERVAPASPNVSQKETESNPLIEEAGTVNPENIGHETCPICILDFEEGDDLRVLPCEGKHRFHQACVDPWLLEMSSSCPLCREDFWTLESMVRGEQPEPAPANSSGHPGLVATPHSDTAQSSTRATRMGLRGPRSSKYLRFAQRRRNHSVQEATNQQDHSQSP